MSTYFWLLQQRPPLRFYAPFYSGPSRGANLAQLTCKFRLLKVSLTAVTGSRTYAIAWQRRGHPRMGRFRSSKSGPGSDPTHLGRPHHVHRRHQGRTDHAHAHVRRSNVSKSGYIAYIPVTAESTRTCLSQPPEDAKAHEPIQLRCFDGQSAHVELHPSSERAVGE